MGHQRIGTLPDTAPWRQIVRLLAEGTETDTVAAATTQATTEGLRLAQADEGLVCCVLFLVRLVQAARQPDFGDALEQAGILTGPNADLFTLIAGFSDAIDARLHAHTGRTDIGEMAQLAAIESLTALLRQRSEGLYEADPADVHRAARTLSTRKGFAGLAHDFFARFTQRFLTYHLGRELPLHVGANGRFAHPDDHDAFVERLGVHCREAAAIMRNFAGDWYDKANANGGVTLPKVRGFVGHAIDKLQRELISRGQRDG